MFIVLDKNNMKIAINKDIIKEIKLSNDEIHFFYKDDEHKWFEFYDDEEAEKSFYDILRQINKE